MKTETQETEDKNEVGITDSDLWNLDDTLSKIIYPYLLRFKSMNRNGYHEVDEEDIPQNIKDKRTTITDQESTNIEAWEWVLDEMIFAFYNTSSDTDYLNKFFIDGDENKADTSLDFSKSFDKEGYVAYDARVKNGLRLFGKYFQALWD